MIKMMTMVFGSRIAFFFLSQYYIQGSFPVWSEAGNLEKVYINILIKWHKSLKVNVALCSFKSIWKEERYKS